MFNATDRLFLQLQFKKMQTIQTKSRSDVHSTGAAAVCMDKE